MDLNGTLAEDKDGTVLCYVENLDGVGVFWYVGCILGLVRIFFSIEMPSIPFRAYLTLTFNRFLHLADYVLCFI